MTNSSRPLPLVALALSLLLPVLARAQGRPTLKGAVDVNDWEAYYNAGIAHLANDAEAAEAEFTWASRLRPDRAEPLLASWVAFWARDLRKFEKYINDDKKTLLDPRVLHADSLRMRAMWRNPFVHQGLIFLLYDRLPGNFNDDVVIRGWIALAQANLPVALQDFGVAVRRDPRRNGHLRWVRASAFVNSRRPDSAAAEIDSLLAQLRAEDARKLGNGYESKAMLEHARGLLHLLANRQGPARDAFSQALLEDASFAPAHAMLGEMALAAKDSASALLEYGLANETAPNDADYHLGLGKAYRLAKRLGDAVSELRKAIAIEPMYAAPYYFMASTLEDAGDRTGAAAAYELFLSRAAQSDARRSEATRKLQELRSTGS